MFPSCPLDQKSDNWQAIQELKIFQSNYILEEKNELLKRINDSIHEFPKQFCTLLERVCHPDFRITIYDVSLLQELKQAAAFLANSSFRSTNASFWQEKANKIDELIQKSATFPLLNLPSDVLFQIFTYLPLRDLSHLVRVSALKISPRDSGAKINQVWYTSFENEIIRSHPHLILEAPDSHFFQKLHVCQKLSKKWLQHDIVALTKLFAILNTPSNRVLRHNYLKEINDPALFNAYLDLQEMKDPFLEIDLSPSTTQLKIDKTLHPILQFDFFLLKDWSHFIKNHSHIEHLKIVTKLNDDLKVNGRIQQLLELICDIQNVKYLELEIPNLTQWIPVIFAEQFSIYSEFIGKFNKLKILTLNCKDMSNRSAEPFNNYQSQYLSEAYQRIFVLVSHIKKLLDSNLQIQTLQIKSEYLPNVPLDMVDNFHVQKESLYPAPYLNALLPVIIQGFKLKNMREIQLTIPRSSVVSDFKKVSPYLKEEFFQLNVQIELKVEDDTLGLLFQKI